MASPQEDEVRGRVFQKVGEFVRREVTLVLPAAQRAAGPGVQAFLKKFSEEYTKERKKQNKEKSARALFGSQGPR